MVVFRLLGPVGIAGRTGSGGPIATPRVRALLVALLRYPDQHVPQSRLAEHVWATPPASAQANLRTYIAALRRNLDRFSPGLGQRLDTRRGSGGGSGAYRLAVAPDDVDASLFTGLAERGRQQLAAGRPLAAVQTLRTALQLWRGPIGEDLPDTLPLRSWAASLTELRVTASEDLAEAQLMLEDYGGLVASLRHDITESPYRERPVELLMRALLATNDRTGATSAFQSYRVRLVDELGMEPSARLHELHLALLRDEPVLQPRSPAQNAHGSPRHAA